MINKKNKKGQVTGIVIFVGILFILLFVGIMVSIGGGVLDLVADVVTPELTGLGMAGDANLTEAAGYTITPLNNIIQSFNWVIGVVYFLALIGFLGLAFAFRMNPNGLFIALYFLLMILLVITSIIISNNYEQFYQDNGDVGTRLQEQTLMSFLILYSPLVITVVGFLGGIILFSGREEGFT